jgi:hypothetical protein
MKKTLIISNIIFIITTIILLYILLFTGIKLVPAQEDDRITVEYPKDLHDLVLGEMRDYLEVINEINKGIADNNPERIVKAAYRQGEASIKDTPARLLKLSPIPCKTMGINGHFMFQAIGDSARINYNPKTTYRQLATLTNNCVVCHKSYKLGVPKAQ